MNALIVGASGHLGAHLARCLLEEGQRVRALVRPSSCRLGLEGLPLEIVQGDVLDPASLARAMRECGEVYHLGAPTGDDPHVARIIREGTRNVLSAAGASGVRRVVYTSSIVTVGYSPGPQVVLDESSNQLTLATPYHEAKWHAEHEALACTDLPVVVVNPSTIVGEYDFRITPSNAPIHACLTRGLPVSFPGGLTIAHAADVARGHFLAMRLGTPGQRYVLGGERVCIPDYFRMICEACGKPRPRLTLPRWAMLAVGLGFSGLRAAGAKKVPFTLTQARRLVGKYGWYSSEKARYHLGYAWRPAEDAVRGFVSWFLEKNPAPSSRRAA